MTVLTIHLVGMTCFKCGCVFGLTAEMRTTLQRTGETFHCPNGHGQVFAESTEQKLAKQLAAERVAHDQTRASRDAAREQRNLMERRVAATRGVITRIKNRVGNGVCPCCNRSFENLHRHMQTKHPEWKSGDAEAGS